jgi:hypothetical protein
VPGLGGRRLIPALPLALVVPAGPSPDGAGVSCSQSGATGYTNSRRADVCSREEVPNAAAPDQRPPCRRQHLLIGIRNSLLIEAGIVALIVLLYWLF